MILKSKDKLKIVNIETTMISETNFVHPTTI